MLRPFQIKDLYASPSTSSENRSRYSHGVVQISPVDYDSLALNHPRARLTYLDDDDGDQIMVGSALELSQRLDEPLGSDSRPESVQQPQDEQSSMHIFDIRRSNSVTELWKSFAITIDNGPRTRKDFDGLASVEDGENSDRTSNDSTLGPTDDSQSLMAAFEAELANILRSSEETSASTDRQPESSRTAETSSNSEAPRTTHPAEILITHILHHLVSGANLVHAELRSKLPEMQRQLLNVQRNLPENVGPTLHGLLATLEAHMRSALNSLPNGGNGLAEEALHAGRPIIENAAVGLRSMASDFNEVGRTLFAAFEHEFGRAPSRETGSRPDTSNTAHAAIPSAAESRPVPPSRKSFRADTRSTDSLSRNNAAIGCIQSPVNTSEVSNFTASPGTTRVNDFGSPLDYDMPHWHRGLPSPPPPPFTYIHPSSPVPPPFRQPSHPKPPQFGSRLYPPPPPYPNLPWSSQLPPTVPSFQSDTPWQTESLSMEDHKDGPPACYDKESSNDANMQTRDSSSVRIFIGNVGFNVTERMIQDVFASRGFIVDVNLPLDVVSGTHAGFGYLQFPSVHPAIAAIDALQGTHIDGHAINLEFSETVPIKEVSLSRNPTGKVNTDSHVSPIISSNGSALRNFSLESQDSRGSKRAGSVVIPRKALSDQHTRSVSFLEPCQYVANPSQTSILPDLTRTSSPPLIDLDTDNSSGTSTLSDRNGANPQGQATESGLDHLHDLNSDIEMSRFPPVSQFEAQLLATQKLRSTSGIAFPSASGKRSSGASGSTPSAAELLPRRARTISHVTRKHDAGMGAEGPGLVRYKGGHPSIPTGPSAHTVEIVESLLPSANPREAQNSTLSNNPQSPLRLSHHANEGHAPQFKAQKSVELDTWARLNRRERQRSRLRPGQDDLGSLSSEESHLPAPPADNVAGTPDTDVEKCVLSLLKMGYGTPQDGGRSRMMVYAAASNGSLFDAIEMIEEERKAYARRNDL